jgi:hypothetical protein
MTKPRGPWKKMAKPKCEKGTNDALRRPKLQTYVKMEEMAKSFGVFLARPLPSHKTGKRPETFAICAIKL